METVILENLMKIVAREEGLDERVLAESYNKGRVAIFRTSPRGKIVAVGENLRIKVNANIGTSVDLHDEDLELRKLEAAQKAGADAVMDLSTGGDLRSIRRKIISESSLPVGSVPIYEAIVEATRKRGGVNGWNLTKCLTPYVFTARTESVLSPCIPE